ncbi:MAG: VOC family protein [Chloroflexi bacterium]|nr:VOC family protein [Chloroflexota bacterium]
MSKHPIVHFELSSKDRRESGDFYNSVFGWEIQHMDEMNYTMFSTVKDGMDGGLNPVSEQNPAGTVSVYIGTDDIEATLAKIEAGGGKTLMPKTEIPQNGWFAFFQDPSGNNVGLFTAPPQA